MRGRFVVDMHPEADALYVYLENHDSEDIADTVEVGTGEVMVFLNKDGLTLGVEIILPPEKRTSND